MVSDQVRRVADQKPLANEDVEGDAEGIKTLRCITISICCFTQYLQGIICPRFIIVHFALVASGPTNLRLVEIKTILK